jgi:adenylosuccinate lyase
MVIEGRPLTQAQLQPLLDILGRAEEYVHTKARQYPAGGTRLIPRYTRPEMDRLWSPERKYETWLEIEIAVCEALAERGEIPAAAMETIRAYGAFRVERIQEIEETTRHDVIAFVQCVAEAIGPEGRFLHLGVTSSDILDTSMAILLRDAADMIIDGLQRLAATLKALAIRHKRTAMIGRTHGVHAEPITLGLKFLLWFEETNRNLSRLRAARETIRCGKISGAVGTYAHIDPSVEAYVCRKLGLIPAAVSNQIIQRDRYAEYFAALAIAASSIEKFALEIRHLQRTEVREAEEGFAAGQKGSSAMPHKRNPILSENLCGLARIVRANAVAAMENIALWHERDISHSSVERVIAPDSTTLVHFMVHRFNGLLAGLLVYPDRMRANIELTRGLVFSEAVLLSLIRKGLTREQAYKLVQTNAMQVWMGGEDFRERLSADPEVMRHLGDEELQACFDLDHALAQVDRIFDRALGDH